MENKEPISIVKSTHYFKINHSETKDLENGKCITSPSFTAGAYQWVIRYYPNGNSSTDAGFMSLFLKLQTEAKNVSVVYDFDLLDKDGRLFLTTPNGDRICHTFPYQGHSRGFSRLKKRDLLQAHLETDIFFFVVCTISIVDEASKGVNLSSSVGMRRPFDLHEQLGNMLINEEMTDVAFEVEGQVFRAHRSILAARSPVFKAELFGPMKESKMECIKIDDMQASVFKCLLHFIYTDSFSECKEGSDYVGLLLAVADRYAVERLRVVCEEQLRKEISIDTVMSTLILADHHNFSQLKKACLQFACVPKNFFQLAFTDEYVNLMKNYPSLLAELKEKVIHASTSK